MKVLCIILNEHSFNKYSFNSMWQGLTVSVQTVYSIAVLGSWNYSNQHS